MINFTYRILAGIVTFFMMLYGTFGGMSRFDTVSKFRNTVKSISLYENNIDTAVPQTDVYNIIKDHLTSAPAEGKTVKKAIVLGYDGCRADTLSLCGENGAIKYLLSTGGTAKIAYCGGVNYPAFNKQATSTAPGWASILTGQWADVHGVTDNGIKKSNDHLTLLTTLVEDGTIDSSAFYVSWNGHLNTDNGTYALENEYCAEKGLNVTFSDAEDDDGTFANTCADIARPDCSDFIFTIFEYTDHAGHDTGFGLANPDYTKAFADEEAQAKAIIDAIEARPEYGTEDWLIIITTDHGGINKGHGFITIQERMTFIAVR